MSEPPIESHCARCLKPVPDMHSREFVLCWEAVVDADGNAVGLVCEDCISPEERQALAESEMELDARLAAEEEQP
jgi:hypothetical protein